MIVSPVEWISYSSAGLLVMLLNCLILQKEYKKRKSTKVTFTTKYLQIWPLLTMICGILFGFFVFAQHFNIFCYFCYPMFIPALACQGFFMGLYQLSRLYYCFSEAQCYSDKGYSNTLFIIMYIIPTLVVINTFVCPWFFINITYCGINEKFQYFGRSYELIENTSIFDWASFTLCIYFLWDFSILLLYTMKIISFKKYKIEQINVWKRIMASLTKILIATIMYEIMQIIAIIVSVIVGFTLYENYFVGLLFVGTGFGSVVVSYSMFIMQEHNTKQYKQLLKLSSVCCNCCCESIIVNALEFEPEGGEKNRNKNIIQDSIFETRDISVKNEHSNIKQLSIETTVY
eukprot:260259_1